MLYDPKWTSSKPSLPGFAAWLETKDPDQRYDFMCSTGGCLVGQYMVHCGIPWVDTSSLSTYVEICRTLFGIDKSVNIKNFPNQGLLMAFPHTFGAALARARALMEATP